MSTAPCSRSPPAPISFTCRLGCQRCSSIWVNSAAGALALISGRPLAELDRLFWPWCGAAAGVHGSERRRADGTLDFRTDHGATAALDHVRPQLTAFARTRGGLVLEDKRSTLALHYRAVPERAPEILAFAQALEREVGATLRLIAGKMVVEFQPRGSDKGTAIAAFLDEPPFLGRQPVSSATTQPTRTGLRKSNAAAASRSGSGRLPPRLRDIVCRQSRRPASLTGK